jgi:hypothetical protein
MGLLMSGNDVTVNKRNRCYCTSRDPSSPVGYSFYRRDKYKSEIIRFILIILKRTQSDFKVLYSLSETTNDMGAYDILMRNRREAQESCTSLDAICNEWQINNLLQSTSFAVLTFCCFCVIPIFSTKWR